MEINDNIFQAIQACWLGKASPNEIKLVQSWLDESEEHREEFRRLMQNPLPTGTRTNVEAYRHRERKREIEFPFEK